MGVKKDGREGLKKKRKLNSEKSEGEEREGAEKSEGVF